MSNQEREFRKELVTEAFNRLNGNISAIALDLNVTRKTIRNWCRLAGLNKKPIAGGKMTVNEPKSAVLPPKGIVKRYILTSAQNNTHINQDFWNNLLALADHYDAEVFVGTYSYNQNNFGQLSVKKGTKKERQTELWFDPQIMGYIKDQRVNLGNGLVWCGEMNLIPTAVNPLSGLETYSHRKSAIFPHAKLAMRSIPTMLGEGTKLNYTTGTVTLKNYIQKKEGLKAEHHHRFAALLVEVDHHGYWAVRQLGASAKNDSIQDLNVLVKGGKVIDTDASVEAITFGDLHCGQLDTEVHGLSMQMLDELKPKYTFIHDVMEGASYNHHESKSPHRKFHTWLRGLHRLDAEVQQAAQILSTYERSYTKLIAPDANHDADWLYTWLKEFDYRVDPGNAELFLRMQSYTYATIRKGSMVRDVNLMQWIFNDSGNLTEKNIKFLVADESFKICDDKIECGMHGHLGPSGSRGTPANLNNIGRRANTAHTHSAGIFNGLYVAGTSSKLRWDYNRGPSSWTNSHIVTYPNGQRTIITMYKGKWRA
jgi:hypothetical protein